MNPKFIPISLFSLVAAPALGGAPVNLLSNGGFEEPAFPGTDFGAVDLLSWTQGESDLVLVFHRDTPSPDIWPAAFERLQYADIGNTPVSGKLTQLIVIPSLGEYTLSWASSTASGFPGFIAPYTASLSDAADSPVVSNSYLANYHANATPWASEAFVANLEAGSYSVGFLPTGAPFSLDILIDDVRLTRTAEPCTEADLAPRFSVLDLSDINAFISGFVVMDPIADLTADGLYDLSDINLFVSSFVGGCP